MYLRLPGSKIQLSGKTSYLVKQTTKIDSMKQSKPVALDMTCQFYQTGMRLKSEKKVSI